MGSGLALIMIGATLRFAVDSDWETLDVPTVGLILMIVGLMSLLVGLFQAYLRRGVVDQRRPTVPPPPSSMPYAPQPPHPSQPPHVPPPGPPIPPQA